MSSNNSSTNYPANDSMARLIALENRTGYTMQQFNGQRKYWNPKNDKPLPPRGCEVFVGKIPRDLFEDELVPIFEKIGQLYELRLMMDFSGFNRGYAFVCYTTQEHAQLAIEHLDNFEVRPGQRIGVCRSVDNCRLFIGGIPKDKNQLEIKQAMCEISDDVSDVIVYPGNATGECNRGFAFIEYSTHRAAAMARRKLMPGRITLFGNEVIADWAEPEIDANDTLNRIKNIYVRNLKVTTSHYAIFSAFDAIRPGAIERVKKIEDRDYAFVHFLRREDALYAVQVMNGQVIDGQTVQVSLAKPPTNKHDVKTPVTSASSLMNSVPFSQSSVSYDRLNGLLLSKSNSLNHSSSLTPKPNGNVALPQSAQEYVKILQSANQQSAMKFPHSLPPPPAMFPSFPPQQITQHYPFPIMRNSYTPLMSPSTGLSKPPLNPVSTPSMDKKAPGYPIMSTGNSDKPNLEPVKTLDHIAKIQCPVVYLDQLSTIFNNGIRPVYTLYSDNSSNETKYVYQVVFMGKTYLPPPGQFSNSVSEAQKFSARYVLKQTDEWVKLKLTQLVNSNMASKPPPLCPPSIESFGKMPNLPKNNFSNSNAASSIANRWKQANGCLDFKLDTPTSKIPSTNTISRNSYASVSSNVSSLINNNTASLSALGHTTRLWNELSLSETSKTTQDLTYQSPLSPTLHTASAIGSNAFSVFKKPNFSYARTGSSLTGGTGF